MLTFLIASLIVLDGFLLLAFLRLSKRQNSVTIGPELQDLTEERRYLTELRRSIQEELEHAQAQSKEILNKVSKIATEAEMEVKNGGGAITEELEGIVNKLTAKFEEPLSALSAKQSFIERLLIRIEREKQTLIKLVQRSEQVCKFFNEKVPYQDILEELQDKKYEDARHMLAKGYKPDVIAKELGLSKSEVDLIAGIA